MKTFIHEKSASHTRMLKLVRWVKRYKKFGIQVEVTECDEPFGDGSEKYEVRVFGSTVRTDCHGNRYVPNELFKIVLDPI